MRGACGLSQFIWPSCLIRQGAHFTQRWRGLRLFPHLAALVDVVSCFLWAGTPWTASPTLLCRVCWRVLAHLSSGGLPWLPSAPYCPSCVSGYVGSTERWGVRMVGVDGLSPCLHNGRVYAVFRSLPRAFSRYPACCTCVTAHMFLRGCGLCFIFAAVVHVLPLSDTLCTCLYVQ